MTESDGQSGEVPNVLLSIEEEHAEAILNHEKLWEYRRVVPAVDTPFRLVLYVIDPVKAAVGSCWVPFIDSGRPAGVVVRTIDDTPHEPDDVMAYFDGIDEGHAIRIHGPRRFDSNIDRSSLEAAGRAPTRNFRYLPDIDARYAVQKGVTV